MSKTDIDNSIIDYIRRNTENCGKVKILLKNRRYYIEALDSSILLKLLTDPVIREARRDYGQFMSEIILPEVAEKTILPGSIAASSGLPVNAQYALSALQASAAVANNTSIIRAADEAALQARQERDPQTTFMISEAKIDELVLQGTGQMEDVSTKKNALSVYSNEQGNEKDHQDVNEATLRTKTTMEGDIQYIEQIDETGKVIRRRKLRKIDQRKAMGLSALDEDIDNESTPIEVRKEKKYVYSIEIASELVEKVRRRADNMGYPMLEEYDFRKDAATPEQILPAALRPSAQIREYQEKALSKMFGNGRARSGIIVLPCGAGKTLVGITAMSTISRSTLIVCSTSVAVQQWKNQVKLWTHLPVEHITTLTHGSKEMPRKEAKVIITTYSMLAHSQKRSAAAEELMKLIKTQEWGLVLLDEVHVAPADKFKICVEQTHSRCKLGLTATLVREDEKITDLFFLLGPKLYEANWMDLSAQGFIATVKCIEIWCHMTPIFYKAFLQEPDHNRRLSLCVANPEKINTLEALIRMHEDRGDKIMVFSEQKFILQLLAKTFNTYFIHGDVPHHERMVILKNFGSTTDEERVNTIFISKIGDNSIDLPDTNVIIQLSAHYSSRRQEAQRLGRILRPKSHKSGSVDAFFYTLITQDTEELAYGTKRQRFLVDQGYAYEVKRSEEALRISREYMLANGHKYDSFKYSSLHEQETLLRQIQSTEKVEDEGGYYDKFEDSNDLDYTPSNYASYSTTTATSLSGASRRGYRESRN